jgi:hypothetical protein
MSDEALVTYLNDHVAGATMALVLLDRLVDKGPADERDFFIGLRNDINQDYAVLEQLLRRIGDTPSATRQLGGWMSATLARVKLMIDDPSRGTLSRFEPLEILALGILGKRALWQALERVRTEIPELATIDLGQLQRRADEQHTRVEARRLAEAVRAFSRRPTTA